MTTAANDTIERSTISGTGPYAFNFRIFNDTDLTAVALSTDTPPEVVPLTLDTHYTVSGVNDADGGTVTLDSTIAATYAGYTLDIRSNTPQDMPTNFRNTSRWLPESGQDAFDYLSRQIQDLNRRLDRTVRFPDNTLTDGGMSPIQNWTEKFLTISSAGELEPAVSVGDTILSQSVIGALLYPRTAAEIAAGVTPTNYAYEPFRRDRYASAADYATVIAAVSAISDSYPGWYRGDRALHPSLSNCIVGFQAFNDALLTGTIGYRCTVFGSGALSSNDDSVSAGGSNCAFGYAALHTSVESSGNNAFGAFAGNLLTGVNASHNNLFGYRVLASSANGIQNNGFGFEVLRDLTTGNNNHGFGESVLSNLVSGTGNICFGYQAHYSKLGGSFSHALGYQAMFNENACVITAITKAASAVITVSTVSSINPFSVGQPVIVTGVLGMTEINDITGLVSAVGGSSGAWTVTVGINSSGFTTYTSGGYLAAHGNTAVGYRAGLNITSRGGNTVVGADTAQAAEPGYGNTLMGYQAGNTINTNSGGDRGDLNSVFGFWAGLRITTAGSSALFGQQAGSHITTGSENVCVGANSGDGISTAIRNVCVGATTAVNLNGDSNTSVGYNAGTQASAQTYTNSGSFGANAVPTASNQITLGDPSIATLRCQQTSITALSDERFKRNITPLDLPDAFLDEVEIVTFEWAMSGMAQGAQVGVIAQQLDELQERYGVQWLGLVDKSNPDRWEATPGKLLFPLIQRVQKLSRRVSVLESA